MKPLLSLLIIAGSFLSMNAQKHSSYAKFSESPEKRISYSDLGSTNFFVEYQSKKKATIYLELIKNGIAVGTSKATIKSKDAEIVKLNFEKRPGVIIKPGNGYRILLCMYEGEKYGRENLVSKTVIEDVSLTRLLYSKL